MVKQGTNILKEHKNKKLDFNAKLQQINFLDQRVYKRDEDNYYPSVTSILNYMPKGKFFETWLKDVGHNADIIMNKAGREGTQVHEAAEALLKGEEVNWMDDYGNAKYSQLVWTMINKFAEFWKQFDGKLIACEKFTYSDEYEYAGTADLVVEKDGKRWLLDIKTSTAIHKSYHLQLGAYAKAWEEVYGEKIDHTGIIWLKSSKRGESKQEGKYQGKGWELAQIDNIDYNFDLFLTIYKLYKMEHPEIKPVYATLPTSVKL